MDFYNKVIQYKEDVSSLVKEIEDYSLELKKYWNGPASDKFFLMIQDAEKNVKALVEHFVCYENAGINLKKLEDVINKLNKKIAENAKLEAPNPSLESEIKTLESQKSNLIVFIKNELEKISIYGKSDDVLFTPGSYAVNNWGDTKSNSSKSNIHISQDSSDVTQTQSDKNVELTSETNTNVKPLPQSVDDIDLGTGKYMTDADWANSPYISKEEFRCKCGGRYCNGYPAEISKILVEDLNKIRVHYGKPIIINSGLRCNTHNKNEGGANGSSHKTGRAVDIVIEGVNAYDLLEHIETNYNEHNGYSYTGSSSGYAGMDGVVHFGVKDIEK